MIEIAKSKYLLLDVFSYLSTTEILQKAMILSKRCNEFITENNLNGNKRTVQVKNLKNFLKAIRKIPNFIEVLSILSPYKFKDQDEVKLFADILENIPERFLE